MAIVSSKKACFFRMEYKAIGGETFVLLSTIPYNLDNFFVFLNGSLLIEGEDKDFVYDKDNNKIVFYTPLDENDILQILILEG